MQPPQPLQPAPSTSASAFPSVPVIAIAPNGHDATQSPQPVHASPFTTATCGSSSARPSLSIAALCVTAASPEATLSLEVFGPWQAPAMKTPSTTVSTGRSFGWISLKKPSRPTGSFKACDQLLVRARHHTGDEDEEVDRDRDLFTGGEQVADRHLEAVVVAEHRRRIVVGEAEVERAALAGLREGELVLAVGTHLSVEVVLADAGVTIGDAQGSVES